jgi:hypothetical protein
MSEPFANAHGKFDNNDVLWRDILVDEMRKSCSRP